VHDGASQQLVSAVSIATRAARREVFSLPASGAV
jgi:hypothetical protein